MCWMYKLVDLQLCLTQDYGDKISEYVIELSIVQKNQI